ncbi:MAG: transposase domain-containing protein [Verrucomicrobia bacterium]|nr:transposase domain-containing protein [Verrucomicrobiota bacterium]
MGRTRYILCHYRDGKRLRQIFNDLPAAKKEARFVAQRIQGGMQHVTDLCRRLGINPKEYLTDVLTRLPAMLAKDAITLTPANWLEARSGKPVRKMA